MAFVGHNVSRTKWLNRALVLECLRREGPMRRVEISRMTRLTQATITNLTAELLVEGLVRQEKGRGRGALLDINEDARTILGVHVRSERVELALVNMTGGVHEDSGFLIDPKAGPEAMISNLIVEARRMLSKSRVPSLGVGVGSAGHVRAESGEIARFPYAGWERVPLGASLRESLELPVVVDHNVRGMAAAENLVGEDRDASDLMFLYVGRGVGSGVILDGNLFRGSTGAAAEIGHTNVTESGPLCWCGNRGCLEMYTSEPAVLGRAEELLGPLDDGDPLGDLLGREDGRSRGLLRDAGEQLGLAVANAVDLFNVRRVVVGGRLLSSDLVLNAVESTANHRSFLLPGETVRIRRTSFGSSVGVVGGAALVLDRLLFHPRLGSEAQGRPAAARDLQPG
jgi:N-acetylglucosamine repressor